VGIPKTQLLLGEEILRDGVLGLLCLKQTVPEEAQRSGPLVESIGLLGRSGKGGP
jgi:hypothetical protein